ncbi:MAG TPA: chemotaxis protein CheX [Jatrophihabitans sp.]|jgi:chemotaxis protein CheX|nr:chemotaxis protein CheX [Jatrophihabitans sp.]
MTDITTEPPVLDEGVFEQIVAEIFGVMLGFEMFPVHGEDKVVAGLTSLVHITGGRPHTVQLSFARALGDRVAAEMFQMPLAELDDEARADALGELANVVGGGVKALFPGHCQLSLPTVLLADSAPILPGAEALGTVVFTDGADTVSATLWERSDDDTIDDARGGLA